MYTSIPNIDRRGDKLQSSVLVRTNTEENWRNKALHTLWGIFLLTFLSSCIIFGSYIAIVYISTILHNQLNEWEIATPRLYHPNRPDSYIAMSIHLFGAAYLMLLGTLQYMPYIRQRYITFHKYNGRLSLLSIIFASIGGIYYVCSVGLTVCSTIDDMRLVRLISISNILFGMATFTCGCGIYYHASYTKRIDMHKRWAYRLAGIFFGNIFTRLYILLYFMIMGEGEDQSNLRAIRKVAFGVLALIFWLPFMLLGDYIWRREQKEEVQNGGDDAKEEASIYKVVVLGLLLFIFIVTIVMQSLFAWIPVMKEMI